GFASVMRTVTLLPNTLAARVIVSSEMATFRGSSKRSSCDRLVWSSLAMACLVFRSFLLAFSNCQARTRLTATASTSPRMPSSSRKLSKLDPLWSKILSLILALIRGPFHAYLVTSSQLQVLFRRLPCLLYETMQKNHALCHCSNSGLLAPREEPARRAEFHRVSPGPDEG